MYIARKRKQPVASDRPSYVCLSVRSSVCSTLSLNRLTFELEFFMCMGHDPISSGTEGQDHMPRSRLAFSVD